MTAETHGGYITLEREGVLIPVFASVDWSFNIGYVGPSRGWVVTDVTMETIPPAERRLVVPTSAERDELIAQFRPHSAQ